MVIYILATTSCTQLPQNKETESIANHSPSKKQLNTEDLRSYKQALYALRDNKLQQAEILLKDVIKNNPGLAGPHVNIGLIYFKESQIVLAKEYLRKAIELNSHNPYAYNILGIIKNQEGDFYKAKEYFLLAIKYKKNYAKAHFNIALLYDIYFHNTEKSINHYTEYLSIINKQGIKDKQTFNWLKELKNSLHQG